MLISTSERYRLSTNQLSLWLNFIEHQVGFVLPASQVNWVKGIIERHLQNTQMTSTELLEAIAHNDTLYHQVFDDILIPRTQFFRHLPSFECVARYSQLWQQHNLKSNSEMSKAFTAWSVGCSTGQEAVSIALTLKQNLPVMQKFMVYGSDFHQQALQRAKHGQYDINELKFIPPVYHHLLTIEARTFTARADIQQAIHYFSQNLVEFSAKLPVLSKQCQIMVCKNVLIYFRQFEQRDIISHLSQFLDDDGIMIFGAGEVLQLSNLPLLRLPLPNINAYCKNEASNWVKQLTI